MRSKIKYISSAPEKFIPKGHAEDTTLNEHDPDIFRRPLIFMVRKLTRDEQFRIREMLELKDESDPKRGIRGIGDISRFVWENCIIEVRNLIIEEADGVKTYEVLSGKAKNDLWNTQGMDLEMSEAILFARTTHSNLEDDEAKN